jgi:hypothetical protein
VGAARHVFPFTTPFVFAAVLAGFSSLRKT